MGFLLCGLERIGLRFAPGAYPRRGVNRQAFLLA